MNVTTTHIRKAKVFSEKGNEEDSSTKALILGKLVHFEQRKLKRISDGAGVKKLATQTSASRQLAPVCVARFVTLVFCFFMHLRFLCPENTS